MSEKVGEQSDVVLSNPGADNGGESPRLASPFEVLDIAQGDDARTDSPVIIDNADIITAEDPVTSTTTEPLLPGGAATIAENTAIDMADDNAATVVVNFDKEAAPPEEEEEVQVNRAKGKESEVFEKPVQERSVNPLLSGVDLSGKW